MRPIGSQQPTAPKGIAQRLAHLEVLVEEPSMEAALQELLPRMLGGASFAVHVHRGREDLLAKLEGRLRGYGAYIRKHTGWRLLVLVDRDDQDCLELKARLEATAGRAQLQTRTAARKLGGNSEWLVVNRIAIEELEAWYFGDWKAVCLAYPGVDPHVPQRASFRNPDAIAGGTAEAFERVLNEGGHFRGGLQKIAAARAVAKHMNPATNTSRSFQMLRDVVLEMQSA